MWLKENTMNKISDNQLKVILGFYYFDYKRADSKKISLFTRAFNDYFGCDMNTQSISYCLSQFKGIDPSFNAYPSIGDSLYLDVWKYYVNDDRINELKTLYNDFKKRPASKPVEVDDAIFGEMINEKITSAPFDFDCDRPKQKYEETNKTNAVCKRDLTVSLNALRLAEYKCEYDNTHPLFLRKNTSINYTEGHHLIPLKYQYLFNVNLDVEANVVSLCSNCHNNIHYGEGFRQLLKKLFEERKERLKKCGIEITFEDLVKMYE